MIDSLLTIVVIVYNTEKYLYDCMDSVVNQTYKNLEIICIDDCSTDRSSKILESYALQDSRIKIITNSKNSGPGITRNAGMDAAQGEYILFIDSDDWIDLTTCEKLITKAMENDAEIVFYPAWQVDGEQRKKIPNHCEVGEPLTLKDRKLLLRETLPSPWSKLWKRSFMMQREIRFPAARRSQDHKPHWMGCVFAEKTGFLDEPLYFYRSNPGQVTRCSDERLLGCIMAQQETEEFLIKENKFNEFKDEFYDKKIKSISTNYLKMERRLRKKFKNEFILKKEEINYIIHKMPVSKNKVYAICLISNTAQYIYDLYKFIFRKQT